MFHSCFQSSFGFKTDGTQTDRGVGGGSSLLSVCLSCPLVLSCLVLDWVMYIAIVLSLKTFLIPRFPRCLGKVRYLGNY